MNGFDRTDVQTAGRMHGNEQLGLRADLAGEDDLLQIAAGQMADRG